MPKAKKSAAKNSTSPATVASPSEPVRQKPKEIGRDLVEEEKHAHHHRLRMTAYVLGACMLVVLIILSLVLARAPIVPPAIPATPETPVITAEPEPAAKPPRTSIGWLFNNQSLSSGTSVAVTGYLRSTKDPAQSKYLRTIADDAGLAVTLTNLKGSQPDLFKNDDTIYTVYGVLRIYSGVAQIEVKSIEPALYPTS